MARFRTPNFHHARFSVAQSLIRELVVKRAARSNAPGLFAAHPIMQAASHVLMRAHQGEITDAQTADAAYRHHRAMQAAQGVKPSSTLLDKIEKVIHAIESVFETAEACTDLAARYAIAWAMGDQAKMAEIRSEWTDSGCDLEGWATAVESWLEAYGDHQEPFYNLPVEAGGEFIAPGPFPLPPPSSGGTLRVGVLGDWGTGEPEAMAVLDQMMRQQPDLLIHVGDVYYAGTTDEQTGQFLEPIREARKRHGRNIPLYTLPGNHDYYSGGAPFYAMIPQLNEGVPNASLQTHSFWVLVNDRWQLQGMDTGYHDSDLFHVARDFTWLRDEEAAWHTQQIRNAGRRGVILFSHHQLVSAFEKIGGAWQNPRLAENLAAWQGTGAHVAAWLWGHEHVLEVYDACHASGSPHPAVPGRCIGNGAFPVFTDTAGYTPQPGGAALVQAKTSPDGSITFPHGFVQSQPDDLVWASGYALLELPPTGSATVSYYQVRFNGDVSASTSQLLWQETIPGPPE